VGSEASAPAHAASETHRQDRLWPPLHSPDAASETHRQEHISKGEKDEAKHTAKGKKEEDNAKGPKKETKGKGKEHEKKHDVNTTAGTCSELWGQCGGQGYEGPTCCQDGLVCQHQLLTNYTSYHQCRPDVPKNPACMDMMGRMDEPCYYKVTWDMATGIHLNPGNYHGLTANSSFKEFQEQNWMYMKEKSKCTQPCAPGACYEVLKVEGCTSYNEWACAEDDGTVAFDCCCKKYHVNVTETNLDAIDEKLEELEEARPKDAPTLFCVAVMMPGSYEVDLLREQLRSGGLGMFGCHAWAVYSNETVNMKPGSKDPAYTSKSFTSGTLETQKGGEYNTSMNTQLFIKFWDKVLEDGEALKYDWIVKLDPDTLFLPDRLISLLLSKKGVFAQPEPEGGMYLNNCFLGEHGPIEVFSLKALNNYKTNKAKCIDGAAAQHGQEDWYLRSCFEDIGVMKADTFNLLLEGNWACQERPSSWTPDYRPPCFAPQVAFHPFKDMHSYMHCWAEAISQNVSDPLDPISDIPTVYNERHG